MLHRLGKIAYTTDELSVNPDLRMITNIFTRISLNNTFASRRWNLTQKYTIKDGDSPESIAEEFYGNVSYWWVVLVANPKFVKAADWPKTDAQLNDYLIDTYGDRMFETVFNGNVDLDQPFISGDEIIDYVSFSPSNSRESNTIQEYYRLENDKKKIIDLITPDQLSNFVDVFDKALADYKDAV